MSGNTSMKKKSNASSGILDASQIELVGFKAEIEKQYTIVKELSNHLFSYIHPTFRAIAAVDIPPLAEGCSVQVGWIQVITYSKAIALYSDKEILSFEVPKLVTKEQKMIIDSNGDNFPWYSFKGSGKKVEGPTIYPTRILPYMTDNPNGNVSMFIPKNGSDTKANLTFFYRKQRFYTYLVLKNFTNNNYEILKALTWTAEVAIEFDVTKTLGERVIFVAPCDHQQVTFLSQKDIPPLENNVLENPSINEAHMVVRRSLKTPSIIFNKPSKETIDSDSYLNDTNTYTSEVVNITKTNFLLQYGINKHDTKQDLFVKLGKFMK